MTLSIEALDRLDAAIAAGTVCRYAWANEDEDGRRLACMLVHMAPECGKERHANACPATTLPPWLAHLVPWITDAGTRGRWRELVLGRFVRALRAVAGADEETFRRLNYRCRAVALRAELPHAGPDTAAVEAALALCDRAGRGDYSTIPAWEEAEATEETEETAIVATETIASGERAREVTADSIIEGICAELEAAARIRNNALEANK